jgi:translocation and assembly module TamB
VVSLVGHGDYAASRRLVARGASSILGSIFLGKIVVEEVDHLGWEGVVVRRASVIDPSGRRVIAARNVKVAVPLARLAQELVFGEGIRLSFDRVTVEDADVDLDRDAATGRLRIVEAFTPRPKPPAPPSTAVPKTVRVALGDIRIVHAHAHGEPTPGVPIDAEGDDIPARVDVVTQEAVRVDVDGFAVRSKLVTPLDPKGRAEYHLLVPIAGKIHDKPVMTARFEGLAASVPVTATARMEGLLLHAEIDAPRVTPDELASVLAQPRLTESVSLHVTADGPPNALQVAVRAVAGPTEATVEGQIHTGEALKIDAELSVRDLDPRLFSATAPSISLGGDARAHVEISPTAGLTADVEVGTFPFSMAGQAVPGASFKGRYASKSLTGTAEIFEPGAPTTVALTVDATGGVDFEAKASTKNLADLPRLRRAVTGSAKATAKGRFAAGNLDAKVDGTLGGLGVGTAKVGGGAFHGRVSGPIATLGVDGTVDGRDLVFGGVAVEKGRLRVSGKLLRPHVALALDDARWSELRVEADVDPKGGAHATNIHGAFTKGDVRTELRATGLDVGKTGIVLRGLALKGDSGELDGNFAVTDAGVVSDLDGTIDLAKASRQAPWLPLSKGKAVVAMHTRTDGKKRTGRLYIKVEGAEIAPLPFTFGADATVDIDGDAVVLDTSANMHGSEGAELVALHARGAGTLTGPLTRAESWQRVTGDVAVDRGTVHVGLLRRDAFVDTALGGIRAPDVDGDLEVRATAGRDGPSGIDRFTIKLDTAGLAVTPSPKLELPPLERERRTWRGWDMHASLAARREDGAPKDEHEHMALELGANVADAQGTPLVTVAVQTSTVVKQLLADVLAVTQGTPAAGEARTRLAALPITARASWVERSFETWPTPIRPPSVAGSLRGNASLKGTLRNPVGSATFTVTGLAASTPGVEPKPIDVAVNAQMNGERATAVLRFGKGDTPYGDASVTANASIPAMIWQEERHDAWTADARVALHGLPLETLPLLSRQGVSGALSGTASIIGLHARPVVEADLWLEAGTVLDAPIRRGHLQARVTGGGDAVTLTLEQEKSALAPDGGLMLVTALPSVTFERGMIPHFDRARGQTAAVQFRRFAVEPFAPFASRFLADLRGFVDGEATLTVGAPDSRDERPTRLWGKLALREGVVLVPQIGQTLTHGTFDVVTEDAPDGTIVKVEGLSFNATSGRVVGSATVVLPTRDLVTVAFGRTPPGGTPHVTGRATVEIDPREKIPVTFEGVPLGDASGHVEATMDLAGKSVDFVLAVPELLFELPETETRGVQSLAENQDVGVMDRIHREAKKARPEDAARVSLEVRLGEALDETQRQHRGGVQVRRAGLDVRLTGRPKIELTDALRVTGDVETKSGRVLALGKPFDVQQGYVRFEGDGPENPYLSLRAAWDAPDGTRVYAELVGRLREAKLKLRSEPARSEGDVLGLVLFGRDPTAQQGLPGQTNDAGVAAGSGVASTVLNSLLDPVQVFGHRIETRVDTTTARGTAIGVATEIRPNLWAQVDVSTAQQQQRQTQDVSAVTLDWRFRRSWSLRTTVGDRGSSTVEVVWQYRY